MSDVTPGKKLVEIGVVDIQDRIVIIEVDEKLTEEEVKVLINKEFFNRKGLDIIADDEYECNTEIRTFKMPGVDEDGDEHEFEDLD